MLIQHRAAPTSQLKFLYVPSSSFKDLYCCQAVRASGTILNQIDLKHNKERKWSEISVSFTHCLAALNLGSGVLQ